jgi:predicted membrane metal-binding protein
MIENLVRKERIEGSSDRMFGLLFAAIFAGLALWPVIQGEKVRFWALSIGAVFLVLALAWPRALSWINRAWMRFGMLLNRIVSPVAIGAVYYLTLVPMGLVMRASGKDPLRLKFDRAAASYWIPREPPGPDPLTMNNQF